MWLSQVLRVRPPALQGRGTACVCGSRHGWKPDFGLCELPPCPPRYRQKQLPPCCSVTTVVVSVKSALASFSSSSQNEFLAVMNELESTRFGEAARFESQLGHQLVLNEFQRADTGGAFTGTWCKDGRIDRMEAVECVAGLCPLPAASCCWGLGGWWTPHRNK